MRSPSAVKSTCAQTGISTVSEGMDAARHLCWMLLMDGCPKCKRDGRCTVQVDLARYITRHGATRPIEIMQIVQGVECTVELIRVYI